jgi:ABC-type transport system involved in cytochrome c biogenesis permease subunit
VLDTNFWLATHVVIVTLGYASTFVAGFLGIVYVVRGFFTDALTVDLRRSLARMVYGIVCFATLFSFVGTVLGGIWADQSWGRFWGWDPKENGAIIIVLWNALILHARWGGLVRERGLMNLAIFGNVVTSWSWFGTNMLGIGLHSYGFMDAAFYALLSFDLLMLALIALGALPDRMWRSLRHKSEPVLTKHRGEPLPV